jgi:hypothetical protein
MASIILKTYKIPHIFTTADSCLYDEKEDTFRDSWMVLIMKRK